MNELQASTGGGSVVLDADVRHRLDMQEDRIDQLIGWGEDIESRLAAAVPSQ